MLKSVRSRLPPFSSRRLSGAIADANADAYSQCVDRIVSRVDINEGRTSYVLYVKLMLRRKILLRHAVHRSSLDPLLMIANATRPMATRFSSCCRSPRTLPSEMLHHKRACPLELRITLSRSSGCFRLVRAVHAPKPASI